MASLFDPPPTDCRTPHTCGRGGQFPDRCATCGHEAYQPAPLDKANPLDDYKRRMDVLFKHIDTVIGSIGEPKDGR